MMKTAVSTDTVSRVLELKKVPHALSIIVPTRNEAGNIEKLLTDLTEVFYDDPIEVIFVDDSTDDTPLIISSAIDQFPTLNVRLIHRSLENRVGGLAGAVTVGLQSAVCEYACVMDGDLQHPPAMVPALLKTAHQNNADLVMATRRTNESEISGLTASRNIISKGLDLITRLFFPRILHGISDPLTGFFLVRVSRLNLEELRPKGFKILLEILIRNPHLRTAEVPFSFGERFAGQSKASVKEAWNYFRLLLSLRFGGSFSRLLGFSLVGLSGILVNSLALYVFTDYLHFFYLLSAAFATVISSLWNFAWIEGWVYRTRIGNVGRFQRFFMFFSMNVLALVARIPLIYLLTDVLSIYYVVSNLVSLAVLTLTRFLFADNMIWKHAEPILAEDAFSPDAWKSLKKPYFYDIHGIVSVVSEGKLPELEPFRISEEISQPTIQVRLGIPPSNLNSPDGADHFKHYQEIFGHAGFEVGIQMGEQVKIIASPSLGFSPHVLYTNVIEPILRWTFVKKGYALVHGATLAFGDDAYLISARTDTGKTTTLLKILARQRRSGDCFGFISDDMTLVSRDGTAMTYPKPMTISHHTLHAVDTDTLSFKERLTLPLQSRIHSRSSRRVALKIGNSKMPAATINMIVQMLIPPPKYYVQKLIPTVKLKKSANLVGIFVIERGSDGYEQLSKDDSIDVLLQNMEDAYGFPPYGALKDFLCHWNDDDLADKEREIIRSAFGTLPATLIRSQSMDWGCIIPSFVSIQEGEDHSGKNELVRAPSFD
jgi:dolichol-phosphate mannosyltransferase